MHSPRPVRPRPTSIPPRAPPRHRHLHVAVIRIQVGDINVSAIVIIAVVRIIFIVVVADNVHGGIDEAKDKAYEADAGKLQCKVQKARLGLVV